MPERPDSVDGHSDVISDVLETMRFTTQLFGRFELGTPWAIQLEVGEVMAAYCCVLWF